MRVQTQYNDPPIGVHCTNHWPIGHPPLWGWSGVYPHMTVISLRTFFRGNFNLLKHFKHCVTNSNLRRLKAT